MIRIGLLGAARIAPKAIVAPVSKRDDCTITAVGARDQAKASAFIETHELNAGPAGYEQVCTDPNIDMIYCALPPSAHLKWVSLALEQGKAVLCEKPFAMNADEARQIVDIAKRHDAIVMEAFHYYFHPAFQKVKEVIPNLGTLLEFSGIFNAEIKNLPGELRYVPELGGGGLMDLGCYPLHVFRSLIGEPEIVSATGLFEGGVDISIDAQLKCGETIGRIRSDMRGPKTVQFRLVGSRNTLTFQGFVAPQESYSIKIHNRFVQNKIEVKPAVTYDAQLDHFINLMAGADPMLPPEDAILQMAAIDKIYALAR